jgi:hypothetical protein
MVVAGVYAKICKCFVPGFIGHEYTRDTGVVPVNAVYFLDAAFSLFD